MTAETLCRDLNSISAWLAFDNLGSGDIGGQAIESTDVIVWFGNQVVATIAEACRLCAASRAPLILSGGRGHSTAQLLDNLRNSEFASLAGDGSITATMGEAEMAAVVAVRAFSIPPGRLILERESKNCGENARFCQWLLADGGFVGETVILIQDPTMQRRSFLTWMRQASQARRVGARLYSHVTFVPQVEPGPDDLPRLVESQRHGTWPIERYIGLLLGEIDRLRDDENGYGPNGRDYFDHVEFPMDVWESYIRVSASPLRSLATR
ncbi:MAG TPA: ElyC/SanA/YdcF family protein [Terracidiphilus sp.]|nr:ElyC/SanA/YdcF family protein [Terracidiphilus sp.]